MKRTLISCFNAITITAFLLSYSALSAAEEQPGWKPDQSGKPQQRSTMGGREGFRKGKNVSMRRGRVHALIEHMDSDGDAKISLDEFMQPEKNRFAKMDGNDDGELTLKEMKSFQINKLEQRIEKQFAHLDSNGDQRVTEEEIRQDRFSRMDKDGDGYLAPRELFKHRRGRPDPRPDGPEA